MMNITDTLVVGASGATGRELVKQLLKLDQNVRVIVRSVDRLPESWKNDGRLTIIKANLLEISKEEMAGYVEDCDAVASCLGHNLSLQGMYGKPRRLVTDAVRLLTEAILENPREVPVRFVLMNTAGNRNRDLDEVVSFGEKLVVGLLRMLLPPHADNEKAAEYLRVHIGQDNPAIQWVAVRPDTLFNDCRVTPYELHASPVRSAVFNPGKTNRINVAHFMARLITANDVWDRWKGKMPVIYNVVNKE
jgi:nucleoside-diphosphate-sugar epimerase